MKKKIFAFVLVMLICVTSAMPAFAVSSLPRLVDDADLLSDSEESSLLSQLDSISERQQVDVVVVTVDSLGGKSAMAYADDYYDYNGYGFGESYDGILFLLAMEERKWHITTTGFGIDAVTDAGLDYMSEQFLPDLKDGDYAEAFSIYATLCDEFITQAKNGEPFDTGNMPKEPFGVFRKILISLGIGFAIALIATLIMKGQLKSVRRQPAANSYVKQNSMVITNKSDIFLYRHVDRHARPKDSGSGSGGSSTHTSSSGSTHGGGGGSF